MAELIEVLEVIHLLDSRVQQVTDSIDAKIEAAEDVTAITVNGEALINIKMLLVTATTLLKDMVEGIAQNQDQFDAFVKEVQEKLGD